MQLRPSSRSMSAPALADQCPPSICESFLRGAGAEICSTVDKTLQRMVESGEIFKVSRGRYVHASREDLLSATPRQKRQKSETHPESDI